MRASEDDALPPPPGAGDAAAATPRKRRPRRGRRKSKAERLSARAHLGAAPADLAASLAALEPLLASAASADWDVAAALARQLDAPAARTQVLRALLWDKRVPKAAAHYAARLDAREPETLAALDGASDGRGAGGLSAGQAALATARFLSEVGDAVVSPAARLRRFVWPWLERARVPRTSPAGPDAAEPDPVAADAVVARRRERMAFRAAARLLLRPPPTAGAQAAKRARAEALQRLLAREAVARARLLPLVPAAAARGFSAAAWSPAALDCHACPAGGHTAVAAASASADGRPALLADVECALLALWPDCRVVAIGSTASGLLLPRAPGAPPDDLDLCVLLPSRPVARRASAPLVVEMAEHLALYVPALSASTAAVARARVPIAAAVDARSGLRCELSLNNAAAVWNTRLAAWLLARAPPAARRCCLWLKRWRRARPRAVAAALSSHALLTLAVFFLQRQGLLPAVDCSAAAAESERALDRFAPEAVDSVLAGLSPDAEPFRRDQDRGVCWWTLVRRFFRFYAAEFDFERAVVSLRTGADVLKTDKGWERAAWPGALSIEDPIESTRDLGALVSRKALVRLRCAFAHSCCVLFFSPPDASMEQQEAALLTPQPFEVDRSNGNGDGDSDSDNNSDNDSDSKSGDSDDDKQGGDVAMDE